MVDGKLMVDIDLLEFLADNEAPEERAASMLCAETCIEARSEIKGMIRRCLTKREKERAQVLEHFLGSFVALLTEEMIDRMVKQPKGCPVEVNLKFRDDAQGGEEG